MPISLGVVLALAAVFCWGFGGYLLQRSSRRFGSWESMFSMSFFGLLVLTPFAAPKFSSLGSEDMLPLFLVSASLFASALVYVEALRRGKLSVVESVGVVEIPIAGVASYVVLHENIAPVHWMLVVAVLVGILLVTLRTRTPHDSSWLEKGSLLGALTGVILGVADFAVGFSARETDPIVTVWVYTLVMGAISSLYLTAVGRFRHLVRDFRHNAGIMVGTGLLDNLGWLAFAFSILFVPIVIALVLSEGYIVLGVILGVVLNKERLHFHQVAGILIAVAAAIILSTMYA